MFSSVAAGACGGTRAGRSVNLNGATVLLVDDELELLDIFAAWLDRAGCKVLTAVDGAEALKVLEAEKVDALVSDLQMPIMDGMTLLRRIDEMGMMIPSMLFLSGGVDVDAREIYALGVERLIEKPLRRLDLLGALERSLLERKEMWLKPLMGPAQRSISIYIDGLDSAARTRAFELGRGGCCFRCPKPVAAGETVDLTVYVAGEHVTVRAQSVVRWYSATDKWAGVEFCYLEPTGQGWVVEQIKRGAMRSFIPGFRSNDFVWDRRAPVRLATEQLRSYFA
jgi:CheY-like chemotaxis protein